MNKFIFLFATFSFVFRINSIALEADKIYKIVPGDTLWHISTKYYNDGFKWGKIYNANSNIITNPDLIFPGSEIKIPEIKEEIVPIILASEKKEEVLKENLAVSTQVAQSMPKDKSVNVSSADSKNISAQKVNEISTFTIKARDISVEEDIEVLNG